MDLFYDSISKRISELMLAVIALGMLLVSVEYVQNIVLKPEDLGAIALVKRICLVLLVFVFTSYNFVAYTAYFHPDSKRKAFSALSDMRILLLFFIDLTQVMITGWLYATLLLGNITDLGDSHFPAGDLLYPSTLLSLFTFMALWHFSVLIWYFVRMDSYRTAHFGFFVAYLIALTLLFVFYFTSLGADLILRNIVDWVCVAFFALCVFVLYRIIALPLIEDARRLPGSPTLQRRQ
jgi:hypothetical protein